jgi:putative protein kinase ArgK-like GTPase of G3E family
VAVESGGIKELAAAIESHHEYLMSAGKFEKARRDRLAIEVLERARDILSNRRTASLKRSGEMDALLDRLMSGETSPVAAARLIVSEQGNPQR